MPSVSLDLPPVLAKEEIMSKYVVIFSLVLSLAAQKVEEGLKELCQELLLHILYFHLVWDWHSMGWLGRDRAKCISEEERGPP